MRDFSEGIERDASNPENVGLKNPLFAAWNFRLVANQTDQVLDLGMQIGKFRLSSKTPDGFAEKQYWLAMFTLVAQPPPYAGNLSTVVQKATGKHRLTTAGYPELSAPSAFDLGLVILSQYFVAQTFTANGTLGPRCRRADTAATVDGGKRTAARIADAESAHHSVSFIAVLDFGRIFSLRRPSLAAEA